MKVLTVNSARVRKRVYSVQVSEPTLHTLHAIKTDSGIAITRLIDQAVRALAIARRHRRR